MSEIEQILLAKAQQDAEQGPRLSDAIGLGAGIGAAVGTMAGIPIHQAGQAINAGKDALAARQGLTPRGKGLMGAMKPGFRMAGGLMGLVAGGALGAGMQQAMVREPSGAGALLAKMQAQGGLSAGDQLQLEQVLREAYSQQGLLG